MEFMNHLGELNRLELEIRSAIRNTHNSDKKSIIKTSNNSKLLMQHVIDEKIPTTKCEGALGVVYASGSFMSVDRIIRDNDKFKKSRRIIYYLDSRPGQIGSTLFLELLKMKNGDKFSKHKFVLRIDQDFFQKERINISSGEINEALSRMFRKTMLDFFGVEGRNFVRKPFVLRMQELNLKQNRNVNYTTYKREIDSQTDHFLRKLNSSIY
ncbi:MAG: hypothetical protein IH840_14545 [Candidatus Heimdallarchaeota archaeon]|nr:hypothetical protein [Candidatus Heimdallarchaeota archaeon]